MVMAVQFHKLQWKFLGKRRKPAEGVKLSGVRITDRD